MLGLLPELTGQNGLSVSWCTTPFSGQMPDTMPGIVRGERVTNVIHRARERIIRQLRTIKNLGEI